MIDASIGATTGTRIFPSQRDVAVAQECRSATRSARFGDAT
jgi:hypothetical protein